MQLHKYFSKKHVGILYIMAVILLLNILCPVISPNNCKAEAAASFAATHGRLSVKGTQLVDKNGKPVQLKGVSTHGINWDVGYPYVTEETFKTIRDKWGVNTVRLAMYTEEYNGYCVTDDESRKKLLNTIDTGVKAATKLGMYVIIDWHVLNDQNPQKHQKEAVTFFKKISKKYSSYMPR